jgi:hypothetical protein
MCEKGKKEGGREGGREGGDVPVQLFPQATSLMVRWVARTACIERDREGGREEGREGKSVSNKKGGS